MLKTYRYKLDPNRKQKALLSQTLDICRELYNMGLEQRRLRRIGRFEQMRQVTELKQVFPEYKTVHAHVLQNVIKRLNRSFENFFRRCKLGVAPGFPRFKSRERYDSFSFNDTGFSLDGNRLSLAKIGNVKVRVSREIPNSAVIKTCTVKRSVNGWLATLTFECATILLPASETSVGIDVGIENFAALSGGTMTANPRHYECGQAELRRAQRPIARRKKGSNRRRKAVVLLRKAHERVANRRNDFLHKTTTGLIQKFGTIVIENLNVGGLAEETLSQQVHDASWGTFFNLLRYKAAEAGTHLIGVDCTYTSQTCPACGERNKKLPAERTHNRRCGYAAHRDTAAAQIILARAEPLGAKIGESIPCLV
jgi:putative transposase